MFVFLVTFGGLIGTYMGQQLVPIFLPVTFYTGQEQSANNEPADYLFYHAHLCKQGIVNMTQAQLTVTLPHNPTWLINDGVVVLQVSKCSNNFDQSCFVATNYEFIPNVAVKKQIIWTLEPGITDYYIRAMGYLQPQQFSVELSFINNGQDNSFNYTGYEPFDGTVVNKSPTDLAQYWRSTAVYEVNNNDGKIFALAYCKTTQSVTGIDVVLSATLQQPYSLMEQWACPQTIEWKMCSLAEAEIHYPSWVNPFVSSYNIWDYDNNEQSSTDVGLFVAVYGYGGQPDATNQFTLAAQIRATA